RPEHEQTLADLRAAGRPLPHPLSRELEELRSSGGGGTEREKALAARIERERDFDFGDDTESKWWHDTLRDLIVGLDRLTLDDPHGRTVSSVEQRLASARTLEERSIGAHLEDWDAVIEAIGDRERSPEYAGLPLKEQLGLAPLGRDPDSGLFEFWHVSSGERPPRGAQGKLQLEVDSGIVLVLVPGGTFLMGAQASNPEQRRYDPAATPAESTRAGQPVEMRLDSFFLSKFELTQGQWMRLFGENPSFWNPEYRPGWITPLHPVEQVSWEECLQAARRLDLALPTEAQWEYACRAGSGTRWSMGEEAEDLVLCCNLKDQDYLDRFDNPGEVEAWADGFPYHAPVGSLQPNRFGFHDMHGNVWEWCLDGYGLYDRPGRPGDGAREPERAKDRVSRGGGFDDLADFVRSSIRFGAVPSGRDGNLGVRLARDVR
ncbi:MAG: formylglycine-generating enzyme family protein, partial [Planctomycetota bacterium]